MEVDIQLYDYVKKFASRLESKGELNSKAVQSLLLICERESHYE
jgi:transcription initiation factor TFIIIB Brf1 subunit/transcription initiation factor TFIIB